MVSEALKRNIRKFVRDGRDLSLVYDLVEISVDDQAELERDEEFQRLLNFDRAKFKDELESAVQTVIQLEAAKGNGATLRWYYDRKFGNTIDDGKAKKPHFPFEKVDTEELRKRAKTSGRFLE